MPRLFSSPPPGYNLQVLAADLHRSYWIPTRGADRLIGRVRTDLVDGDNAVGGIPVGVEGLRSQDTRKLNVLDRVDHCLAEGLRGGRITRTGGWFGAIGYRRLDGLDQDIGAIISGCA